MLLQPRPGPRTTRGGAVPVGVDRYGHDDAVIQGLTGHANRMVHDESRGAMRNKTCNAQIPGYAQRTQHTAGTDHTACTTPHPCPTHTPRATGCPQTPPHQNQLRQIGSTSRQNRLAFDPLSGPSPALAGTLTPGHDPLHRAHRAGMPRTAHGAYLIPFFCKAEQLAEGHCLDLGLALSPPPPPGSLRPRFRAVGLFRVKVGDNIQLDVPQDRLRWG